MIFVLKDPITEASPTQFVSCDTSQFYIWISFDKLLFIFKSNYVVEKLQSHVYLSRLPKSFSNVLVRLIN